MRDDLSRHEREVRKILESPALQQYVESHTPSPAATVIHSKAEILHFQCQNLSESLDDCIAELAEKVERRREGIIMDLEGLEDWVGVAYSMVLLEPNRLMYPPNIVDEGNLRVQSEGSSVVGEGEEWQGRDQGSREGGVVDDDAERGVAGSEEVGVAREEEGGVADGDHVGGAEGEEDTEFTVQFSLSQGEGEEEEEEEGEMAKEEGAETKEQVKNGSGEVGEERVNDQEEDLSPSQTSATITTSDETCEWTGNGTSSMGMGTIVCCGI